MLEQQNNAIDLSKVQSPSEVPPADVLTSSKIKMVSILPLLLFRFFDDRSLFNCFKNMSPSNQILNLCRRCKHHIILLIKQCRCF